MSELAKALAAFQAELPTVAKDKTADMGTFKTKYADLASLSRIVLPAMAKHGLSFSSKPTIEDGRFVLVYVLRHESGEEDRGVYPLPDKSTPQQIGSAITYARRYALSAIAGVAAEEDDDGKAAADTKVDTSAREYAWDPMEQEELRDGYLAEIGAAKTVEEIIDISRRVESAKRARKLSPNTYDRVFQAGAAKRGELNGKKYEEVTLDGGAGDRQPEATAV